MTEKHDYEKVLTTALAKLYPDRVNHEQALSILNYGNEDWHRETHRVRLAIVKLAGSSLEKLQEYAHSADQDFRDVLYWAEYPNQAKDGGKARLETPEYTRLQNADIAQYEQWIQEMLR